MTISDLQRVLEASIRAANPLMRELLEENHWDATEIQGYINRTRDITIATVLLDGRPHAASVIGACVDGLIHFSVSFGSALLANLRRSPWVAFTVTGGDHVVMGRGHAELVSRSREAPDLLRKLSEATHLGRFTPEGWDGLIYAIDVERIFGS
ncbi:MAG: pyridoxamine 5'-phosphate oxidase family protein [Actinomycetota bacterium]